MASATKETRSLLDLAREVKMLCDDAVARLDAVKQIADDLSERSDDTLSAIAARLDHIACNVAEAALVTHRIELQLRKNNIEPEAHGARRVRKG